MRTITALAAALMLLAACGDNIQPAGPDAGITLADSQPSAPDARGMPDATPVQLPPLCSDFCPAPAVLDCPAVNVGPICTCTVPSGGTYDCRTE